MAQQTIDDTSLVRALLDVFRTHGYEGATLALLSKTTGLKKSSLYHRFPAGKDDMVNAVVRYVNTQLQENIIAPLLNSSESPEQRFKNMLSTIDAYYENGSKNCLWNVLNLGEIKTETKAALNSDYCEWLSALIKLGEEAGMTHEQATLKSKHFLITIEGSLVIQRVTSDLDTFKNSMEYQKNLFFNT